jgi:DNA-binding IclR family transcriptional regulator
LSEAPDKRRRNVGRGGSPRSVVPRMDLTDGSETKATSIILSRGLDVLRATVESEGRVETVADDLGLPRSTVYRYIKTLCVAGFLEERSGQYVPGIRLLQLAQRDHWHQRVSEIAEPVLQKLVEKTEETSFLLVRVGRQAVCPLSIESMRRVRLAAFPRESVWPLHAGATAKVLLAFAPARLVDDVIASGLERLTDRTPDVRRLRRDLEEIRARGVAVSRGELDPDATAVAAPVFWQGEIVCSVSVAGPTSRLDTDRLPEIETSVRRAADEIAGALERALSSSQ